MIRPAHRGRMHWERRLRRSIAWEATEIEMGDPKDTTKVVPGAFHGEGDADAGVVTETVVGSDEAEDIEESEDADVSRIEKNEKPEPGP
ncbi:hypothetical protein [Aureimonas leprariae]|uniref:Uncharacterized protein n=1 Tax=Plantimonas leprariae TaxID=2615207 RepID=A0A7V7PMC3_9HYPH|nr:hypothetical protein [Aureimonas leprariae]KAB0678068.1 hypothetical protein F6X38_16715 [Aureimonas leprariae]